MSQTNECQCDNPVVNVHLRGLQFSLDKDELQEALGDGGGSGARLWESDWFDIAAASAYTFQHDLNLEAPWRVWPRIVARVKLATAGWSVGDIIFGDGSNYVGSTASSELGWAICLSVDEAQVSFGNSGGFMYVNKNGGFSNLPKANVECKLLITY